MTAPDENVADEYADAQRRGWRTLVREIEQKLRNGRQAKRDLTRRQSAFVLLAVGGVFVFWTVWTATWPIPRGKENRENAAAFLKKRFPDRHLTPDFSESATAPVAALFHVVRRGKPDDAAKAIAFGGQQKLGYASPYVIERLESDNPRVRSAARSFLQKMSGTDLGPRAAAWKAWWRDPPRRLLGVVTVGHNSFHFALPIVVMLIGGFLAAVNRRKPRDFIASLAAALLLEGWFLLIGTLGLHFVGGFDTCEFGGTRIAYYSDHGVVLGLEDARVGGGGLWLLLVAAYLVVPLVAVFAWAYYSCRGANQTPPSRNANG